MIDCRLVAEGSFRDPEGRLYQDGDRILREVYPQHAASVVAWLESPLAQRWMQQRRMAPTRVLSAKSCRSALLQHERVFFPSYPWEWTPGQWVDAASLTLDLCEEALDEGRILKDATPLNILFSGACPMFVDVLSFEDRDARSPVWIAYAQFARTFLLPLSAYVHLGWPLSASMQRRDGFEPADLAPFIPLLRRWRQPLRSLVTLPALLEKTGGFDTFRPRASEEFAAYAVRRLLRSTRELLRSLSGSRYGSRWSNYVHTSTHYKSADQDAKQAFVESALAAISPSHVLDVGANSGVYSRIAAHAGAEVVAWDTDVEASDLNWQWARREGLRILPIVADFARPAPAVGWRNEESASLLDRAKGRFDFVLMLGILHHLLIADQIPLEEILAQLWEISSRWAIVEWISREDPQFESLCRGRQELYSNLSEEFFLHALEKCCAIRKQARLPNGRILCLVEKCS